MPNPERYERIILLDAGDRLFDAVLSVAAAVVNVAQRGHDVRFERVVVGDRQEQTVLEAPNLRVPVTIMNDAIADALAEAEIARLKAATADELSMVDRTLCATLLDPAVASEHGEDAPIEILANSIRRIGGVAVISGV